MCAWDEQSVYEMSRHRGRWTIVAQREARVAQVLLGGGDVRHRAAGRRALAARRAGRLELRVRVVRQMAERLIVTEVKKAFEAEAATLRDMATLI